MNKTNNLELCAKCNGTGLIKNTRCYYCFGTKYIEWIDNIIENPNRIEIIKRSIENVIEHSDICGDINDFFTRNKIKTAVKKSIEDLGPGASKFEVICDGSNNNSSDIEKGNLNVDIIMYKQPTDLHCIIYINTTSKIGS